ncbi:hypothetical protein ACLB2K_011618 [Fragaria x ananassa]
MSMANPPHEESKSVVNIASTSLRRKPKRPSWFTPKRLLLIFCVINLINYVDRGAISSNGVNGNLEICENGICTPPTGIHVNPFRLIGVGLSVWTFAVTGCGFSFSFLSLFICRMLVGVGEASFISLAAPFIDDNAPAAQAGFKHNESTEALILHETVVSQVQGALNPNDRAISMKEDVTNSITHEPAKPKFATKLKNHLSRFMNDMKDLLVDKVYIIDVLGYVAYTFVIGSYSYYGPKAGYNIYHMTNADMIFGGITIVCGILGTLAGGFLLDFMSNTISNAFKLLSTATFLGALLCFGAFCCKNMYGFLALFAVGQLLLFATMGPVNFVCLHCVKPSLRPLSMAISTVAIHIFGDVPSSPVVGVVQDHMKNWRSTVLILTSILIPAAGIWFTGIFLDSADRSEEESDDEESDDVITTETPSLEENKTETTESAAEPVTYSTGV